MTDTAFSYADPSQPPVKRRLIQLVEAATGQRRLKGLYLQIRRHPVPSETFFGAAVRLLALSIVYDAPALDKIPRTGPLVVVANHPYGVLDGIVVSWLVEKIRTDFLVASGADGESGVDEPSSSVSFLRVNSAISCCTSPGTATW